VPAILVTDLRDVERIVWSPVHERGAPRRPAVWDPPDEGCCNTALRLPLSDQFCCDEKIMNHLGCDCDQWSGDRASQRGMLLPRRCACLLADQAQVGSAALLRDDGSIGLLGRCRCGPAGGADGWPEQQIGARRQAEWRTASYVLAVVLVAASGDANLHRVMGT